MNKKAILVLEDGTQYEGLTFGAECNVCGEIVFDTAMTGYQEMLTDPSFAGQIVVPTYPLIGNYGINDIDIESDKIQVSGFIVSEYCEHPSNWQSKRTLHEYLKDNNIAGLHSVDTRALTRHIRTYGTMMGIISNHLTASEALIELRKSARYDNIDFVPLVSTKQQYSWDIKTGNQKSPHIVIVDMGLRYNIARILSRLGSRVTIVPVKTSAEEILDLKPDGLVLSPGPSNPALLTYVIDMVKNLLYKLPVMGICLGHQLIAIAMGAKTYKLKFGHRGANHPVKDLETGKVHITMQNHGFAVDADSIKNGLKISHINVNDNTVEGLRHEELPIISIQYHAEGAPGPQDNIYLFKEFMEIIERKRVGY